MRIRIPLAVVAFVLVTTTAFSQPSPDLEAAKLKEQRRAKLIERIRADAEQLKLPDNRAMINTRLGVVVAKTDRDAGIKQFQAAIADLLAAQEEAEAAKVKSHLYHDLLQSSNTRPQILTMIAGVDAELALESFYKTRPTAVANALATAPQAKIDDGQRNYPQLAQSEINLEQRLLRMVADQKPEKAAPILKDTIKKRLSTETYESLKRLYQIDPNAALELADDVISRLNSANFMKNDQPVYDLIQLSTSIITDHIRERGPEDRYLSFSDARVRTTAIKLLATYTQNSARIGYIPVDQLAPFAKRYDPGAIAQLRKAAESTRTGWGHRGIRSNPEYNEFLKTEPTADQMVQAANRFAPELRREIYQNAANKFSESGQYQTAIALLNDKLEGDSLENAVSSLNWFYAHHLMNKGELDAAEAMMYEFNDSNRISALTSLAQNLFNKNPTENRARAAGILRRVRSLMPERPENYNETHQLFMLINATTAIEPNEAFSDIEPIIEHLNLLIGAFAIVQGYQGGQLRNGEYLIAHGTNFGIQIDPTIFRNLAQHDFDRTNMIIDAFQRAELRIGLRMLIAENF